MYKWVQKKERKIQSLREMPYDSLSVCEKLEIVQNKLSRYPRIEKISYEEFELACLANWELDFDVRGVGYEIVHITENKVCFLIDVKKINGKCTWFKEETYATSAELLEKVRIYGQTIKQIWDEVTC